MRCSITDAKRRTRRICYPTTDKHLLPVFAALGAVDDDYSLAIQSLGTYQRSLAMTNYVFGTA